MGWVKWLRENADASINYVGSLVLGEEQDNLDGSSWVPSSSLPKVSPDVASTDLPAIKPVIESVSEIVEPTCPVMLELPLRPQVCVLEPVCPVPSTALTLVSNTCSAENLPSVSEVYIPGIHKAAETVFGSGSTALTIIPRVPSVEKVLETAVSPETATSNSSYLGVAGMIGVVGLGLYGAYCAVDKCLGWRASAKLQQEFAEKFPKLKDDVSLTENHKKFLIHAKNKNVNVEYLDFCCNEGYEQFKHATVNAFLSAEAAPINTFLKLYFDKHPAKMNKKPAPAKRWTVFDEINACDNEDVKKVFKKHADVLNPILREGYNVPMIKNLIDKMKTQTFTPDQMTKIMKSKKKIDKGATLLECLLEKMDSKQVAGYICGAAHRLGKPINSPYYSPERSPARRMVAS